MEFLSYKINYEYDTDLYTVTAQTKSGETFAYTFSENHTLKELRYTLEKVAKQLDK
ncbi:hypothetical protein [Staphylococcus haemolyticus]|uniref:hypothetical protein n=1 Tax=Staphylococcus haemolyticus TaxID=1283 RepID=UPI001F0A6163|nr:hypothetical protein [Staphylococcus haemolyticus]MCH4420248.1 hypothetical protein [Staphylococcus haemolyticus]